MPNLLDQRSISFHDRPLLFIDLETTGLDVRTHEIVEIAALLVDQTDFQIKNSYYTKVVPTHIQTADPNALKIIGYDSKKWLDAIPLEAALKDLSQFAPGAILAGWSVQTEWDFLVAALEQKNLPYFFTHRLLEVYTLAYAKFHTDKTMNFLNLSTACKALDIYLDQHKPDSDIRATYEIFIRLIKNPLV